MELKDFVENASSGIIDGLVAAQTRVAAHGAYVNPGNLMGSTSDRGEAALWDNRTNNYARSINFDVALTVQDGTNAGAKIGVAAGVFNLGAGGSSQNSNTAINRVQFSVPVLFPSNNLPEEARQARYAK
ncbi:hypothetical protein [Lysobacter sp. D1-1-M9]|uniref:hypothetical protein n=1 Tax=Novilysobacter longmucuonensis TaxID=3098603 RepID=UPI002FCBFDDF